MIYQISKLTVLLGMVIFLPLHVYAQNNFYAYHTKLSHTSTDYFGKYADLIVSFGEGKQLEFTHLPVKPIMSRDGKHLRGFT
jgi:hypothetical protein